MLKKDLVKRKISLIQDDLAQLAKFKDLSLAEITGDFMKQATVERLLERIISRAIDINEHLLASLAPAGLTPPKDYRDTFRQLAEISVYPKEFAEDIAKSVGTRNLLVHEYDKVDYEKIYASIGDCLRDYHNYIQSILQFLGRQ